METWSTLGSSTNMTHLHSPLAMTHLPAALGFCRENPLQVGSGDQLSQHMCRVHNVVNRR
jgi:hypothetical protein